MKEFLEKLKESTFSILPISMVVLILGLVLNINTATILCFLFCFVFLVVGLTFFSKGADSAMFIMGEAMGSSLARTKKTWLVLISGFLIGTVITFAEPDLQILAEQISSINKWLLIAIVAVGVGVMFVVAMLRIMFRLRIKTILQISFGVILILGFFVPKEFLTIAFDCGATTTGNLSVPLMLAFGFGMASMHGGKRSDNETFGIMALGSVGPIISIMVMGLFVPAESIHITETATTVISTVGDAWAQIGKSLLQNMGEVAIVLIPILVIFFIFQFTIIRLPKQRIMKILVGVLYAYIGIVLFLAGASIGFMSLGSQIGSILASKSYRWVLIPVGALLGFCIVIAEPAVIVLNKNVELITFGAIKKRNLLMALAIGVALASAMAVIRVLYNIDFVWFIVPMYVISLILSFFTKDVFSAIAFDSGGVAAGTMSVSLILPMISGVCETVGADLFTGAFGSISFISAMPVLIVEILGVLYTVASKRQVKRMNKVNKAMSKVVDKDNDIVSFRY